MISDWSGAALEYAFGLEKPVIFIDVPRKVNNPEYTNISAEPFEVWVRDKIGDVVSVDQLFQVPQFLSKFLSSDNKQNKITSLREDYLYNFGNSRSVGAHMLCDVYKGM
jgi:hypothetical protein